MSSHKVSLQKKSVPAAVTTQKDGSYAVIGTGIMETGFETRDEATAVRDAHNTRMGLASPAPTTGFQIMRDAVQSAGGLR